VGSTLTATAGVWTAAPETFTYAWERCAVTCQPVPDASTRTYTITDQDGGYRLAVVVTATNPSGSATADSAQTDPIPGPPVGLTQPAISGTPIVGAKLTASTGSWTGQPSSFTYQWLRCTSVCSPIQNAAGASYVTTSSDHGATLEVVVAAHNDYGERDQTSAATSVIVTTPKNVTKPVITGTFTVGSILTANPGTWTEAPTSYAFRWQRCGARGCTSITSATGSAYVAVRADHGHSLRVIVTAANAAGKASTTSARTPSIV
jgi:hypothetical protein